MRAPAVRCSTIPAWTMPHGIDQGIKYGYLKLGGSRCAHPGAVAFQRSESLVAQSPRRSAHCQADVDRDCHYGIIYKMVLRGMWCPRRDRAARAAPVGWCGITSGAVSCLSMQVSMQGIARHFPYIMTRSAVLCRILPACLDGPYALGRWTTFKTSLSPVQLQEQNV